MKEKIKDLLIYIQVVCFFSAVILTILLNFESKLGYAIFGGVAVGVCCIFHIIVVILEKEPLKAFLIDSATYIYFSLIPLFLGVLFGSDPVMLLGIILFATGGIWGAIELLLKLRKKIKSVKDDLSK